MNRKEINKRTMNSLDVAFGAFQKKDFKKARTSFQKLKDNDSLEQWQQAKMNQYLTMCNRELENDSTSSANGLDSSLASLSVLINEKCYDEATEMLNSIEMENSSVLYLRAEMAIEQGLVDESIALLNEAIEADSSNKGYALHSPSFQEYLQDERFSFLAVIPE